ncbi:hypothetical protein TNCV_3999741 [Trichonephila clavipes]|nr:hypothetical protein TNCV_3999741 [Trichonephila clavipes]
MWSEVPTVCFYWSGGVAMSNDDRLAQSRSKRKLLTSSRGHTTSERARNNSIGKYGTYLMRHHPGGRWQESVLYTNSSLTERNQKVDTEFGR